MLKVLIVDDDDAIRLAIKKSLENDGRFEITQAVDGIDAVRKNKQNNYDFVILDVDMPRLNGLDALKQIKECNPGIIVLMVTAYANIKDAVESVRNGAFNYLSKPISSKNLLDLINKAIEAHQLISHAAASAPILMEAGRKIIGHTAHMKKVFNIINKVSKVDTPVLIRGASGTGKELVARAIHYNSTRKEGKFVAINCSAIPENLFESELFGHEKGSFTGADQRKIGKFQYAENGTIFLDEIGDMPLLMQVKLLRVLQEKVFTPVGSNREIQTNVRIIAATNKALEEQINQGFFRDDLFYRLNVMPIFLPALKERTEDIENLIYIFIKKFNRSHNKNITGISRDVLACLKRYNWPGNIRELENVIEHAFVLENSNAITLPSLSENVLKSSGVNINYYESTESSKNNNIFSFKKLPQKEPIFSLNNNFLEVENEENEEINDVNENNKEKLDFNAQKEAFEKKFIIKALKTFKGRINQTALHANIPKKTLLRKIEKYGINAQEFSK